MTVAVNTNDKEQKRIAKLILEDMRIKDTKLVDDAQILSSELMRIAITPQVFIPFSMSLVITFCQYSLFSSGAVA